MRTTSRAWRQGGDDFTLYMIPTSFTTLQMRHSHQKNQPSIDKTLQASVSNRLQYSSPHPDSQDFLAVISQTVEASRTSGAHVTGVGQRIRHPCLPFASKRFVHCAQRSPLSTKTTKSLFAAMRAMLRQTANVLHLAHCVSQRGRIAGKSNKRYSALEINLYH